MSSLLIKPRKGQKTIKWEDINYHFTRQLEIFSPDIEEIITPTDFPADQLTSVQLNCPNLKRMPSFLGSCNSLELLKIKNSQIENLENHDYDFFSLKTLQLSNLGLNKFPEWIEKSLQLQTLDLNSNKIVEIPDFLKKHIQLRRINLDENLLKKLPDFLSVLPKLNHLSVDSNSFEEEEINRIFKVFKITIN